jgi:muconate cycloisomerase
VLISFHTRLIKRKRPLRISRGIAAETLNLFVKVEHEGIEGIGEMAPVGYGLPQTAETAERSLRTVLPALEPLSPGEISRVEQVCLNQSVLPAACAALNIACFDWLAKRASLPLYQLLGLSREMPPTSITVGILDPEEIRALVPTLIAETRAKVIKLKLGGDDGIEADKCRFIAAAESVPNGVGVRVDANGGWNLNDAIQMTEWLSSRGCAYVEQPLHYEDLESVPKLFEARKLPIFYDESVRNARDAAAIAPFCDGVNVKLMKTGGISEALRTVAVCRALNKSTMIGCFSESSIAISAGAAIGSLFDHIDLDSHLNQDPDPASGIEMRDGVLIPSNSAGLGARLR